MKGIKAIALLFSGGKFEETAADLADDLGWYIYEEKMHLQGKAEVLKFCQSVADYFKTITTQFEMSGIIVDTDKVAIYGKAEFIREGETVNRVDSCDIYEFDTAGKISRIFLL